MANVERLKFIQAIISRMAGNSFLLKGWSLTLAAALAAIAESSADATYAVIGALALVIFAFLDCFYLTLERIYRQLYQTAVADADENWDLSPKKLEVSDVLAALRSWSVVGLYVPIIGVLLVQAALLG
jgi:hypothetical protein